MTAIDTSRADKYEAAARAAMAAGFANETRRTQDGIELVSRAYSELRSLVNEAVWSVVSKQDDDAQMCSYDLEIPFNLHNLRDKHAAYALEIAPAMGDVVKRIQALLALRNEIKAMPLLPRKTPKREQAPEAGGKTQARGHCQCCGREHAVRGTVAQHGYEVKHGFFNGVCPGYNYSPMEVDRAVTDQTVSAMRAKAAELDSDAERVKAGELKPKMIPNAPWSGAELVPFDDAAPRWQARALESMQRGIEQQARGLRQMADSMQSLADKYHGQPLRIVKI